MTSLALDTCLEIAAGTYLEGLAIDSGRETVWYSDVIAGGIHAVRFDGTKVMTLDAERAWTGGILVDGAGRVLSSGQGGIRWNDPARGTSGWLLRDLDGAPVNGINEMCPDGADGLFFGTVDLDKVIAGETPGPTAIYRLAADGAARRLADLGFSNGLMFDPGRGRLYCNDTFSGTWAFDVAADFTLGNRTLLIAKEDADGMALDADGNLWITGFRSSHFTRVSPDGTRLPDMATPAGAVTQLRFAGPDLDQLWFNSVPAEGGDTLKEGGTMTGQGSFLHRAAAPARGLALPRVALAPALFRE